MAVALKSTPSFLQLKKTETHFIVRNKPPIVSTRRFAPMASLTATRSLGIGETFSNLKKQGKVALIPYITAGDPDLSTTAEALKLLDACGCDIIELGVPYSDPLADGPVIQAAATRSLARGTNFEAITSMLKEVVPQVSCPIALFTYYNPILKRGIEEFMSTVNDIGVHGLVVPDVPLEETQVLRKEAVKNGLELVLLTTPTTPTERMKAIVEAAELAETTVMPKVITFLSSLLQRVAESNDLSQQLYPQKVSIFHGLSRPAISIQNYLERIFKYANCSPSCFVVAYVYLDRFAQRQSCFPINSFNVHRLLITSVLISVKFMDDIYYNNAFYAKIGGISTAEMNLLEVDFLFGLGFQLNVTPTMFHAYCSYLQREMLIQSPLPIVDPPLNMARLQKTHRCFNEDESTHQKQLAV